MLLGFIAIRPAALILVGLLALDFNASATIRTWIAGNGNWSDPSNWSPAGAPQNGDDLVFDNSPDSYLTNDMANLTVRTLEFHHSGAVVGTNSLTVTVGINALSSDNSPLAMNFPTLNLGADISIGSYGPYGWPYTLNCTTMLNGHTLNCYAHAYGTSFQGPVTGPGQVNFLSGTNYFFLVGSGVSAPVSVTGSTLTLNGTAINAVSTRLDIGAGGVVILYGDNRIANTATVNVSGGGQLMLNGYLDTIDTLNLTNLSSDLSASTVDAGNGGLLGVNSSITSWNSNSSFVPVLKGRINLNGPLPFVVNGTGYAGLDVQATLASGGGIIKTGTAALLLESNNTFSSSMIINQGIVDVRNSGALGASGNNTLLNGGSLTLRNVSVSAQTLSAASGTVAGDLPGAVLTCVGSCSWFGQVGLATNLDVLGDINFGGAISGTGGIGFFGGGTSALSGTSDNTYTGVTLVRCPLLQLNKSSSAKAFNGSLIVGGITGGPYEARWLQSYQRPLADVTVFGNGFVNLNGLYESLNTLTYNGGLVDSGPLGQLGLYSAVTVNPGNASASLNGNLVLPSVLPAPIFHVGSGSNGCDLQINAVVTGPGGFQKDGQGTLCLNSANTFDGVARTSDGILQINNDLALGNNALGHGTVVVNGGTLRLSPGVTLSEPLSLSGSGFGGLGALNVSGTVTFSSPFPALNYFDLTSSTTIRVEGTSSSFLLSGIISGTGPLTKAGPGLMVTAGSYANSYTGDTVVQEGVLEMNKPQFIVSAPGNLVVGPPPAGGVGPVAQFDATGEMGGTVATINASGLLYLGGNNLSLTQLNLNDGGSVQTAGGILSFPSSVNSTVNVGSQDPVRGSHHSSSITGRIALPTDGAVTFFVAPYSVFAPFDFNPELDVPAIVSGPGPLATEGLYKTGAGQMRLSGNNTFAGFARVNGGTLIAASPTALGTSADGTSVNNDASLAIDGGISIANEALYLASSNPAALDSRSGSNTWSGPITLAQPTGIRVNPTSGYLLALNAVGGAGGLVKSGAGNLRFWGFVANTYSGLTTINEGMIEAGRVNLISVPGDVVIGDDSGSVTVAALRIDREQQFSRTATINIRRTGFFDVYPYPGVPVPTPAVRAVVGSGLVNIGTGTSLTVSNDVTCIFSGQIGGTGLFNKRGAGLLQLTGANTLTGNSYIYAGTLQMDGSMPSSTIQVNSSGKLQGNGVSGPIDFNGSTAVVAPGASTGTLTCGNVNPDGSGGGVLQVELNGTNPGTDYDQLNVQGTVNLTGLTLSGTLNFSSSLSNSFTIIRNDGADAVIGTFSGLPQNSTVTIGTEQFRISYNGGDGNDVVLTQVSEVFRPTLSIASPSPGSLFLSWQTNDPGFTLTSTTSLTNTSWTPVSPAPVILGGQYVVTTTTNGPLRFYRLSKP